MTDPGATGLSPARLPLIVIAAFAAVLLGVAWWFVSLRAAPPEALGKLLFVTQSVLVAGGIAALWLAAAMGWGRLARPLLRGAVHPFLLQLGCGIAILLWLEYVLGMVGLLTRAPVAWALAAAGVVLLLQQVGNPSLASLRPPRIHPLAVLLAPPIAILLVAASSMPGWLWDSENFGFDALEYHLQLPADWLASGRLWVFHTNIYSYLPGYLEAGYLHIAAAFGSVHAAGGLVLLSAQYLHTALTLATALMAGHFVAARLRERGAGASAPFAGTLAAAAMLSVPYCQANGSVAYNEMALNILLLTGFIASVDRGLGPLARGALVGGLAGAATGVKLTGIFMVGAPLGLVLLLRKNERRALVPAGGAAFLALLPYFLRNGLDSGNPVFPFATSLFGLGHWTPDQLVRWKAWHQFTGTLAERLSLAWANGPAHPLWSVFFLLLLGAAVAACLDRAARPLALAGIAALAVQILGWMFLTHLFARFLLPLLPCASILIGVGFGSLHSRLGRPPWRALVACLCALAILPSTRASLHNVARQRHGNPAQFVGADAYDLRTGGYFVRHPDEFANSPIEYATNFMLPPGSRVFFIGESRVLYTRGPKIYNTGWDRSPLGELIRRFPDDPAQWASGLSGLGVTHVRVSMTELDRIQRVDRIGDPLVSLSLVEGFLADHGRLVARKGEISAIYALRTEASGGAPPPR